MSVLDDVYGSAKESMQKVVDGLTGSFSRLRTGRASTAILDSIHINYYGAKTPLKNCATLSVPEANMIVIQPWDPSIIETIAKTIQKSDLGLNPASDGKVIRITIPALSEERRMHLVKLVKGEKESAKVSTRNIRRDTIRQLKDLEKNKEISEDQLERAQEKVQEITDDFVRSIDTVSDKKVNDILNE